MNVQTIFKLTVSDTLNN